MTPSLQLTFLGTFAAHVDGQPLGRFPTDKVRALLAYLVLEAPRPQRRETLATLLWPDSPDEQAKRNLRQTLYLLRQVLDQADPTLSEAVLVISRQTVHIQPTHMAADVWQLAEAATHPHPTLAQLGQAAELYHGDLLTGFSLDDAEPFEEWLRPQREKYHQYALAMWSALADAHSNVGQHEDAYRYAQKQLRLEPWREVAHRQAMRALWQSGQRTAALAHYETCRHVLEEELGVAPDEQTAALYAQILAKPISQTPTTTLRHHFPALPRPIIGREAELAHLSQQLHQPACRLLTLCGAGGMGKTRLAMAVAQDPAQNNIAPDGIYFVPLAAVATADNLPIAIAHSLNLTLDQHLPVLTQLADFLQAKQLLLVLDNIEHLLEGAGVVQTLLEASPALKVLVTSREPLGLRAEWRFAVEGLAYEQDGHAVALGEAGHLFAEVARQMNPQFTLHGENRTAVAEICRLVQGMPLALEMAAGWVRVMDCPTIAQQIQASLDMLHTPLRDVPERQRSIRAIFEHTWQTLPPPLQTTLTGLAIFRGGFTLPAAIAVTGTAVPALAILVDKTLVRHNMETGRYEMHELLRQFAAEKGATYPGVLEKAHAAHARYYLAYLRHETVTILPDLDNVRQAWQWAAVHQERTLLGESATDLAQVYLHMGLWHEAYGAFMAAVGRLQGAGENNPATLICQLLRHLARTLVDQGRYEEATHIIHTIIRLVPEQAMMERIHVLHLQAIMWWKQGRYAEIHTSLDPTLQWAMELEAYSLLGRMMHIKGNAYWSNGQYAEALAVYKQSYAFYQQEQDTNRMMTQVGNWGVVYWKIGRYEQALDCYQQALTHQEAAGNRTEAAIWRGAMGLVYLDMGQDEEGLAHLDEALDTIDEAEWAYYAMDLLVGKISLARRRGDLATAESLLTQAQSMADSLGHPNYVLDCLLERGYLLLAQRRTAEATQQFQHLLQREFRLDNLAALHETLWRLTGDEQHAAEALHLYQQLATQNPDSRFPQDTLRLRELLRS